MSRDDSPRHVGRDSEGDMGRDGVGWERGPEAAFDRMTYIYIAKKRRTDGFDTHRASQERGTLDLIMISFETKICERLDMLVGENINCHKYVLFLELFDDVQVGDASQFGTIWKRRKRWIDTNWTMTSALVLFHEYLLILELSKWMMKLGFNSSSHIDCRFIFILIHSYCWTSVNHDQWYFPTNKNWSFDWSIRRSVSGHLKLFYHTLFFSLVTWYISSKRYNPVFDGKWRSSNFLEFFWISCEDRIGIWSLDKYFFESVSIRWMTLVSLAGCRWYRSRWMHATLIRRIL